MGLVGSKCGYADAEQNNLGRIVVHSISAPQTTLILDPSYHGPMAPKSTPAVSQKKLVCFYCNKRSNIRYDGLITQWVCTRCESTNFLDEVSPWPLDTITPDYSTSDISLDWWYHRSSSRYRPCILERPQILILSCRIPIIRKLVSRLPFYVLLCKMSSESTSLPGKPPTVPCGDRSFTPRISGIGTQAR